MSPDKASRPSSSAKTSDDSETKQVAASLPVQTSSIIEDKMTAPNQILESQLLVETLDPSTPPVDNSMASKRQHLLSKSMEDIAVELSAEFSSISNPQHAPVHPNEQSSTKPENEILLQHSPVKSLNEAAPEQAHVTSTKPCSSNERLTGLLSEKEIQQMEFDNFPKPELSRIQSAELFSSDARPAQPLSDNEAAQMEFDMGLPVCFAQLKLTAESPRKQIQVVSTEEANNLDSKEKWQKFDLEWEPAKQFSPPKAVDNEMLKYSPEKSEDEECSQRPAWMVPIGGLHPVQRWVECVNQDVPSTTLEELERTLPKEPRASFDAGYPEDSSRITNAPERRTISKMAFADLPDMDTLEFHLKKHNLTIKETWEERVQTLEEAYINMPTVYDGPIDPRYAGSGRWDPLQSRRLDRAVLAAGPNGMKFYDHLGYEISYQKVFDYHNPPENWGVRSQAYHAGSRFRCLRRGEDWGVTCHKGYCLNETALKVLVGEMFEKEYHEVLDADIEMAVDLDLNELVEVGQLATHDLTKRKLEYFKQLRLGAELRA